MPYKWSSSRAVNRHSCSRSATLRHAPWRFPVSSLVPGYERLAEWRLPEARVGAVENGPGPTSWEQLTASTSPRHVALWLILLGGVAMLGFMAWRLSRQVR